MRIGPAFLIASVCAAQSFDAASVRPAAAPRAGERVAISGTVSGGPGTSDPVRIVFSKVPLLRIIANAFSVPFDQVSGPDWLSTKCYDIIANVPEGATKEQASAMLQNLLRERFHLTFHYQKKDFPGYELRIAPGGPKLKTAAPRESLPKPNEFRVTPDRDGFPQLPPGARQASLIVGGRSRARFAGYSIADFVTWLRPRLGAMIPGPIPDSNLIAPARIWDQTQLTGSYDFTLEYAGAFFTAESLPPEARARLGEDGPSIFQAIEKQLGLKLEPHKIAADVLMVDRADKLPVEN